MNKLYRVTIPVTDIDQAASFYRGLLSEPGERISPGWHYFNYGSFTLACHDAAAEGDPATSHPHREPLFISTEETLAQVRVRALALGAPQSESEARLLSTGEEGLMVHDPFGNCLCMVRSSAVQRGRVTGPKSTSEPARKTHVLLFQQEFLNAVKGGELGRVKELLAMDPDLIFASDASGVSVLLIAAYKRNQRVAAHLLSLRDELNIWEAAALGHRDHLAALLDADSSQVNAPAVDGYIPLGLASFFGHLDCAGLLLEYGADVNAVSRNAMRLRPLHSAVTHDDPARAMPVTQLLLSAGANVNAAQERGYTALHRAADRGSLELVQLLMRHGADAGICAENGLTAAEMAIAKCYHEIAAATGYRAAEARF